MNWFVRQSGFVSAVVLTAAAMAFASSATANLGVSANLSANCSIRTTAAALGACDPIVANVSTPRAANGVGPRTKRATTPIGLDAAQNSTHAAAPPER